MAIQGRKASELPVMPTATGASYYGFDNTGPTGSKRSIGGSPNGLGTLDASGRQPGVQMSLYTADAVGAAARTYASKLDDFINVKDFGAVGNGIADDTLAIQACLDYLKTTGGKMWIPSGKYRTTAKLFLDMRGNTGAPNSNIKRISIEGDGQGNTVILPNVNGITGLHIQGDNPLTSASHAYLTLSGFSFGGNSPTPRTCDGLWLQDVAYLAARDVSCHNLNVGFHLQGCLASVFDNIIFNESTKGALVETAAAGPHANLWTGCEFRFCTSLGYDGLTAVSGANFIGCRFESNGTMGSPTTGAIRQVTSATAGEHGINLNGCYIEGNKGGFDIQFTTTGTQRASLNVAASCFNRVSSTEYVTNCIVTVGNVDLNLAGNTFTSYNTYVPDVARPYLVQSAATRLRDTGNRYEDAIEGPTMSQSLPFSGFVQGSLGAGVTGVLPNNWSVTQIGAGIFQVTHGLGHTNYIVTATTNTTNTRSVQRCVRNPNSFQIVIINSAGALTDDDAGFHMTVLRPTA